MFLKKPSDLETRKEIWTKSSITEKFCQYEIPILLPPFTKKNKNRLLKMLNELW